MLTDDLVIEEARTLAAVIFTSPAYQRDRWVIVMTNRGYLAFVKDGRREPLFVGHHGSIESAREAIRECGVEV
jgi:hypothetical protein